LVAFSVYYGFEHFAGSCAQATAGGQFSLGSTNFPIGPTASEDSICTTGGNKDVTSLQILLNGNTYKLLMFKV
jgi:hypothetical protein